MKARLIAASCGTLLAALGYAAGAQTIEITSPSIGTVTVRPQTIDKRSAAASARRAPGGDARSSGVDLGIRRNADGSLHDALDPRQNAAAGSPLQYDAAANGPPAARNGGDMPTRNGNANRANVGAAGANPGDFPYGVNGGAR